MSSPSALAAAPSLRAFGLRLAPALFVVFWSTGFIGAKLGLPFAGPMSFLFARFSLVTLLMLAVSLATGAAWPAGWREAAHIAVVGALLQGIYLGGVFISIAAGVSTGLTALIVGLQPLLTAALAGAVLGERVTVRQWLGCILGLVGVALVVAKKLSFDAHHVFGATSAAVALIGITLGTLYQKRFCSGMDLRSGTVIQNGVAAAIMLAGVLLFEGMRITWSGTFVFALVWVVLVLSIGATLLLFMLLRRGAAAPVTSLFYLVPPVTALMAFLLFGETLSPTALLGMGLAVLGVALVNRR